MWVPCLPLSPVLGRHSGSCSSLTKNRVAATSGAFLYYEAAWTFPAQPTSRHCTDSGCLPDAASPAPRLPPACLQQVTMSRVEFWVQPPCGFPGSGLCVQVQAPSPITRLGSGGRACFLPWEVAGDTGNRPVKPDLQNTLQNGEEDSIPLFHVHGKW